MPRVWRRSGGGPDGSLSAEGLAAGIERRIWRRIALANLTGVVPASVLFVLTAQYFQPRFQPTPKYALVPIAVYLPAYLWSRRRARTLFRPIGSWVSEDRPPTTGERLATIGHARKLSVVSLYCWIWALAWTWLVAWRLFEPLGITYFGVTLTILLSAMIGCSLCYLAAEDALRPLFAKALTEPLPRPATVGVLPRLASTWVFGSASYFVAIIVIAMALPEHHTVPFVVGACVVALGVGASATIIGSRSVARPLDKVRDALARVEGGDLDVSLDVDDAGEIGKVQAGFNRMAAGLRERDRLKLLFDRHVGPDVAQRAVASSAMAGEVLNASVLFVDVLGSTALASERPPDAVVAMLNGLFSAVVEVVGDEGGIVNQFQGDGALCIFGAPREMPDHAARATRAATRLRERIVRLGDAYPGFDAAIGVSSGRVVGGDVGTENRYEYTVIGDAANEASRLTDEAKKRPSRVLVSRATVDAAGPGGGNWILCGEIRLRGKPEPTEVFEPSVID